jgi:hypothetical protein
MTSYAPAAIEPEAGLSREQFELICAEAATDCTNSETYLSNVLAELRRWLSNHGNSEMQAEELRPASAQVLVIHLYQLLEENCDADFDISSVLNLYSPQYVGEEEVDRTRLIV